MFGEDTYKEDIKSFKQIHSTEADKLLSSEKLTVVYIGRETCPYCRKFAKKLGNLYNKLNTVIYYVNSEDFSDNEISSFREKYHVVTVPGFIVSKNGKYEIIEYIGEFALPVTSFNKFYNFMRRIKRTIKRK